MRRISTVFAILLICNIANPQKKIEQDTALKRNQIIISGQEDKNKKEKNDVVHITPGASGVKRSIGYKFTSLTEDSDPGPGIFRLDKNEMSGLEFMITDVTDISGEEQSGWYSTWDKNTGASGRGRVTVADKGGKVICVLDFTGIFIDKGGYWKMPVKYVSGYLPPDGTICYFVFERIAHDNTSAVQPAPIVEVTPVVQPAPIVEVTPVVPPAPVVEVTPVVQPAPVVEVTPVVQPAPVVEVTPVVQPAPVVEVTPVVPPAPVVEVPPVVQPAPVVEVTPVVQPAPVVEVTPVIQPAPVVEVTPVVPPAPVVEITPVVQPAPVAEVTPVVQPAAVIKEKPSTINEPVAGTRTAASTKPVTPDTRRTDTGQSGQSSQRRQTVQTVQTVQVTHTSTSGTVQSTQGTVTKQKEQEVPSRQTTINIPPAKEITKPQDQQVNQAQKTIQTQNTQQSYQSQPENIPQQYGNFPVVQNIFESQGTKRRGGGRWYRGIIEIGYGIGLGDYGQSNFKFNFINGFRLGKVSSIGLGIGFRYLFVDNDEAPYLVTQNSLIPVFVDFRAVFSSRKLTPYLAAGIGGYSSLSGTQPRQEGLLFNASAGLWYNFSGRFAIFGGLVYEMQKMEYSDTDPFTGIYKKNAGSAGINLGIAF